MSSSFVGQDVALWLKCWLNWPRAAVPVAQARLTIGRLTLMRVMILKRMALSDLFLVALEVIEIDFLNFFCSKTCSGTPQKHIFTHLRVERVKLALRALKIDGLWGPASAQPKGHSPPEFCWRVWLTGFLKTLNPLNEESRPLLLVVPHWLQCLEAVEGNFEIPWHC